jgi:hypothetical protein
VNQFLQVKDKDKDMADAPVPALAKQFSEAQIARRAEIQ